MFKDCIVIYKGASVDNMLCQEVFSIEEYTDAVGWLLNEGYQLSKEESDMPRAIYGVEYLESFTHVEKGRAVVSRWLVSQMVEEQNLLLNS